MAVTNKDLRGAVLAVSALHIAHLQPARRDETALRATKMMHPTLSTHQQDIVLDDSAYIYFVLVFAKFSCAYRFAILFRQQCAS